ncbi:MAG: class I SAM-dependent methyltransferase [Rhodopseudomonas palustris]|uniref:Class I SAM-dependent methyltransferase n=1 Tax=Rhodopseudomonas palustris TaxID=1076 RepID=A0A933S5X4_RHOPL|nr:class I SAM-dependent methyltransferase [Rhodopseudomonas palustris]
MIRHPDGSAGDADYAVIGERYADFRRPEPRIAAQIAGVLGGAETVLNVGAGAGSYEPTDRDVTAVEPSASMRAQRPAHLPRAIDACAEALPFPDRSFDAAMATFSVHQWSDLKRGLAEMRRVTRGPIVLLSCDPVQVQTFWLNEYAPEVLSVEARRYPSSGALAEGLGGPVRRVPVPIPLQCRDGFNEAYFGRPEMLLRSDARSACSAWSFVTDDVAERSVARLRADLESGAWDATHGSLRRQAAYIGSLYLFVSNPTD